MPQSQEFIFKDRSIDAHPAVDPLSPDFLPALAVALGETLEGLMRAAADQEPGEAEIEIMLDNRRPKLMIALGFEGSEELASRTIELYLRKQSRRPLPDMIFLDDQGFPMDEQPVAEAAFELAPPIEIMILVPTPTPEEIGGLPIKTEIVPWDKKPGDKTLYLDEISCPPE